MCNIYAILYIRFCFTYIKGLEGLLILKYSQNKTIKHNNINYFLKLHLIYNLNFWVEISSLI